MSTKLILSFEWACDQILQYEGSEFTNDLDDPGGATKWGITLADYRLHINPKGQVSDIKSLSRDVAVSIYKKHYWDAIKGDQLPFYLAFLVFDFGVNAGVLRSVKFAQKIMSIPEDGIVGPQFMGAADLVDSDHFIAAFHDQKMAYYHELRTYWKYGTGWARRALTSKELAKAIVTEFGKAKIASPLQPQLETKHIAEGDILIAPQVTGEA